MWTSLAGCGAGIGIFSGISLIFTLLWIISILLSLRRVSGYSLHVTSSIIAPLGIGLGFVI